MTTERTPVEPGRRARAIAASVSRIMRLRDGMRGDTPGAPARPFVDLGCGDGRVAALISLRASRAALGADAAPDPRAAIPVVVCESHRLPFPDGAADYVTLSDGLRRSSDPVALLRDALRVARHGVILTDRLVRRRTDRVLLRMLDAADGARASPYWTERQWWAMAEAAGAQVTHWERLRDAFAAPASWVVGRHLHVVMVLELQPPIT